MVRFLFLVFIAIAKAGYAQDFGRQLEMNHARMYARLNQYDPDRYNLLVESGRIELKADKQVLDFQGAHWQINSRVKTLEKNGQFQVEVTFKCISGEVPNASVSVDLDIEQWNRDNYVLMPSAAYNGNRYEAVQRSYTPFFVHKSQIGLNKPLLLSDHPRLNFRDGYSRIQERSGSMALPSVGFHAPAAQKGVWVCFTQGNSLGDYGVDIEENKGRTKAVVTLTSPVVRQLYKHSMTRMDEKPSSDVPAHFKAGSEVTIAFLIDFFESSSVQSLYTELRDIRKKHYPAPPAADLIPFSKVYEIIENHKNIDIWNEKGYYGNNTNLNWMAGWCGGFLPSFAMFVEGNTLTQQRVRKSFDWMSANALSPSGYFYDVFWNNRGFGSQGDDLPFGTDLVLTRKNAEGIYYGFRYYDYCKKQNIPIKNEWITTTQKALNAQLATYAKYKQLGQYVNQQTGELVIGGTTCSGIFPATLCAAYQFSGNADYLETAKVIGEYYYTHFVQKGITNGGPADALQCFDSESCYGLLESFMELYESTLDPKWLTAARETADQFATWVVAYDYKFPAESDNAKAGTKSTGTVFANTQNKTAPAGICTHSGVALLKLYRASGDAFYLNLLRDIAHTIPQFMSWPEHQLPGYKDGWIYERCNLTDWEKGIGAMSAGSCWAETSMLLSAVELPGVYVNKEKKEVFVIDHVEAKLNPKGQLEITNPTQYDAVVKVLIETNEQRAKPLRQNAFLGWRKVKIEAGKAINLTL
ncbi:hypothetical protein [Runella sp.]|uniref:hypothetical protein n=1 Tax=Runella sp. TaxID=1960881 RepID=UPI002606961A|nr:hypothetical protein [Runella sp.]